MDDDMHVEEPINLYDEGPLPTTSEMRHALEEIEHATELFLRGHEHLKRASKLVEESEQTIASAYLVGRLFSWHTWMNVMVLDDLVCLKYDFDVGHEGIPSGQTLQIKLPGGGVYTVSGKFYHNP